MSNITLDNLQWAGATAQQVIFQNVTYFEIDDVTGGGGTYALDLNLCFNGVVRASTLHDGSAYALRLLNCSEVIVDSTRAFNNPPGSGGTNSTGLIHVDSSYGCTLKDCTTEPQGTGNVMAELVIDSASGPNVSAHLRVINHNFDGLPTTKTNSCIIGLSGAAYVTRFENCRSIKPSGANSLQITSQQDTQVVNCADLSTYDAVPYTAMTITNSSGNPIWAAQQAGFFDFLQSNARLIVGTNGGALTTILKGIQAMAGTSVAVSLGVTLSGSTYNVFFTGEGAGGPFWITARSATGFTINAASSFTGNVEWMAVQ